MSNRPGRVVVVGNEKGGSGKSTVAMHLAVALLGDGFRVGTIDLDARQGTLTRFVDNRKAHGGRGVTLSVPQHTAVHRSKADDLRAAEAEDRAAFEAALASLQEHCDFVVIDTPGSDSYLSRLGHSHADVIVTPLNDSFIDLDILARVNGESMEIERPSHYSELLWEQKKQRALRDRRSIDWIVLRNRLSHLDARNKRQMGRILEKLSQRLGFRMAAGFSERVVFRELFLKGLTLLDVKDAGVEMTMSHVAARAELRTLLDALGLSRPEATAGQEGPASS
ncbi:MAG: AAA family ATPase [Alphaproteobacteria bacterium]|nr:AAA family ATPase [Alphaproteobacteria bacterium]